MDADEVPGFTTRDNTEAHPDDLVPSSGTGQGPVGAPLPERHRSPRSVHMRPRVAVAAPAVPLLSEGACMSYKFVIVHRAATERMVDVGS
ncbi:hypothetical protein GCM10011579_086820 [Streptomyces albiflavescens]|uniref:Uncharacterized protein n=1 Tax=Streptomyces albiflavescens TaxID=1623582 RepID=A0A918D9G7_9ACTN|nr:hypothetical protein GCM10011579_086820 [Streptomyces albiflavescens]